MPGKPVTLGGPNCAICGSWKAPAPVKAGLRCPECGYTRARPPVFYDKSPILDGWDWQPKPETEEEMGLIDSEWLEEDEDEEDF